MKIKEELYFPVPIYRGALGLNESTRSELIVWLKNLQFAQPNQDRRSARNGWQSKNLVKHSDLYVIQRKIESMLELWGRTTGLNEDYQLIITEMWANCVHPGGYHVAHRHPGYDLSGVYYLQADDNAGDLVFYDPREGATHDTLAWVSGQPRRQPWWSSLQIHPEADELVMFPSYMQHRVETNRSYNNRISVSFNVRQLPMEREG